MSIRGPRDHNPQSHHKTLTAALSASNPAAYLVARAAPLNTTTSSTYTSHSSGGVINILLDIQQLNHE